MNIKKWLLAATMAAGMATGASAATLTGSSSGEFTSEDASDTCTIYAWICWGGVEGASGVDTSTLEWPGDNRGLDTSDPARSSLTINNTPINVDPVPLGTDNYLVGSLTWENASSPANITPDEFSADATIDLLFTSPTNQTGQQSVTFNITNTNNPDGDLIFAVANGGFDFGFDIPLDLGGGLTLNGFSAALLSGSDGMFANGEWSNPENGSSTLGIYANVTAVPLPAAGWLMIAGIGGLAAMRRRRKPA